MEKAHVEVKWFQVVLERREAELVQTLRSRNGMEGGRSPDPLDEIQHALERDLAIRNADFESSLLREARAALRRIHDGTFGTCIECEWVIGPRRLAAVPWAPRCIRCQEAADLEGREITVASGILVDVA